MAMTDFAIIRKSITSRWFASVVTVATVALSVALLLVILSLRNVVGDVLSRGSGNMHILVSRDVSPLNSVLNAVFYSGAPARAFRLEKAEQIAADPRIEWGVMTVQGDNYRGFPTLATNNDFFVKFQPAEGTAFALASGTWFGADFDVVLGAQAAAGTGLRLGDSLTVRHGTTAEGGHVHDDHPYKVVGILQPTGTAHDRAVFITMTSTWIVHADDIRQARGDNEEPTKENLRPEEKLVTGMYVRVRGREGTATPAGLPAVYEQLRADSSITVASPSQEINKLLRTVGQVSNIFLLLAGVVMISGAATIMLVTYQAMEMRRKQIAILRVLGASKGRVFGLTLTESAVIGLIAGVVGAVCAWPLARVMVVLVERLLGPRVEPQIDLAWVVVVVAGAVVLASIAGLVAAWGAYRTEVLGNLR